MSINQQIYYCKICERSYKYEASYLKHTQSHSQIDDPRRFKCQCGRYFTRKTSLSRHMNQNCKIDEIKKMREQIENEIMNEFSKKLDQSIKMTLELKENVDRISKKPRQINNILQVLCVGQKGNHLDMLADQCNSEQASEYIKNYTSSNIDGDIRSIQKTDFNGNKPADCPILFMDKKRIQSLFVNENRDLIDDPHGTLLAQRLGNNLQSTYLKGVNYLIDRNLNEKLCPNILMNYMIL